MLWPVLLLFCCPIRDRRDRGGRPSDSKPPCRFPVAMLTGVLPGASRGEPSYGFVRGAPMWFCERSRRPLSVSKRNARATFTERALQPPGKPKSGHNGGSLQMKTGLSAVLLTSLPAAPCSGRAAGVLAFDSRNSVERRQGLRPIGAPEIRFQLRWLGDRIQWRVDRVSRGEGECLSIALRVYVGTRVCA